MKKLLQIIALTTVVTLLTAFGNSDEKEIQTNISGMMHAVIDGDVNTFIDLAYLRGQKLSDEEREQVNFTFDGFSQEVKQEVDKKGGLKSIKIKDIKINGDAATATMVTKMGNGSSNSTQIQLHKEDGKWKVDMKQSSLI